MSEHAPTTTHPIGAIVMLLIFAGLVTWGIGLMNDGNYVASGAAALLLFLTGLVMVLKVGKP